MVALLVAAIALQGADPLAGDRRLDASVTYVTHGEALSGALRSLSSQVAPLELGTAAPFGNDIVALRLSAVPLREAMKRIAVVLDLEWRRSEAGYQLYQTPEKKKAAETRLADERLGRLKEWRREHRDRYKLPRPDFDLLATRLSAETAEPMPDPNKNWEAYNERARRIDQLRDEGDPASWFASALIAGLTDDNLSVLFESGSISFSTKPNRLQHELPKGIEKDLQTWAVRKGYTEPAAIVRVRMVDSRQVKVSVGFQAEGGSSFAEFFMDLNDRPLPSNSREPKGSRLDAELQIEGYLGMAWGWQNSRMPSPAVMAAILEAVDRPDKREPLSVMAGAGLVEIAEETDHSLVALLGDDMIALGSQTALPTNGRRLLAQFCDDVRASYTDDNGWITVRPAELSLSRAKQFPRKILSQVGASTGTSRLLPFSEVARIVSECSDLQLEGRFFRDFLTDKAGRQEFTLLRTWGDLAALRFWHSLNAPELAAVFDGGIAIGRLDSVSRNLLWRAVSLGSTTMSGQGSGLFNAVFRDPRGDDPTRVFPDGFPANEALESRVQWDDCVLASFTPGPRMMNVSQSIEAFAGFAEPNKADLSKIRLGRSHTVVLIVDKVTWFAEFREDVYDYSRPTTAWKDAPRALLDRYEHAKRNPRQPGIIIR